MSGCDMTPDHVALGVTHQPDHDPDSGNLVGAHHPLPPRLSA